MTNSGGSDSGGYSHILVPIDGSPTARRALAEAARLARVTGARLRLLHIVDPLKHLHGSEAPAVYLHEFYPAMRQAGEELLAQARAGIEGLVIETELCECKGERVSERIVERAADWGADLIVLGTHGRRGIGRVMMGSDAEQVARTSPVPVLLVRAGD